LALLREGTARLAPAAKCLRGFVLEVGVVVPVVFLKLFDRHAEPARSLPQVGTLLHQPGRRRVTQGVANDILVKPCILQDAFPRRAYLAGQRLAVMRAVDDKANLVASSIRPVLRSSAERFMSSPRQRWRCGRSRVAIFAGGRRFLVRASAAPRPR
jgi:hypothetical protein